MREDSILREEVSSLVDALFESRLDTEGAEQLEDLVTHNPLASRYYFETVGLYEGLCRWSRKLAAEEANSEHVLLDSVNQESNVPSDTPAETPGLCNLCDLDPESLWGIPTPKEEPETSKKPILGFLGDCFNNGISFLGKNIVLAIVLLPLLAIATVSWMSPSLWESPQKGWTLAARVVNTVDCQWKQGGIRPGTGSFLIPGQKLELELGLIELEFSSGAQVILEGPAEFTINGENSSNLALGRLAAAVPKGAEGFTVETPNMDVIDLGTEFGVVVEEDGNIDVHVFKGLVQTKVTHLVTPVESKKQAKNPPKRRELQLEKDQAVQYDKTSNAVVTIPVDKKSFVRSLDRDNGVVANLSVINPSFELPNIRTIPEFQKQHGSTLFRPVYGWSVSGSNREKTKVAMYQISPYDSSVASCNVGPGATDGQQVATISLGVKASSAAGGPRSNWMYQSLGIITSADLGKTLKLSVDAGPRSGYGGQSHGDGTVFAAFATHVTSEQSGTMLGTPVSFRQGKEKVTQLHHLEVRLSITPDMVGQKLFILLAASDQGGKDIFQYHFDNVEVAVED